MTGLSIIQLCADRGVAPGATKGAAQHLRGLAAGFARAGHQVVAYTARQPEGPFPVPVHGLGEISGLRSGGVDVVYERYSLGSRTGLDLARRLGARFVLEVNAPLVREAQAHRPDTVAPHHGPLEELLLREADLVISVSTPLTRWIRAARSGPVLTLPNGFEPRWFAGPPSHPGCPTLAFIGHPKPWHGADRLPRLLLALRRRGHEPRLLVIGGGPGADRIREDATRAGIAHQLCITGALPPAQASARLRKATIGLAPYPRQEGFYFCPLKVVDYLAAGLPIVSTDQGDIARLVDDAGLVVDPDDETAFADAVTSLLDDPERARRSGDAGRRRAHASMTWDHVAAQTLAAIRALDAAPAGAR